MATGFDKTQLHGAVITALDALVENAKKAVQLAYDAATHEENVAENKYDTLGLEAAYLTQGQARRLAECEADLAAFKNIQPKVFSPGDAIAIGALIQLLDEQDQCRFFLLGPAAGGLKVPFNHRDIVVITPSAPLGKALQNCRVGDEVSVKLAARPKHYEVVAVY